jgi:uridine kinase
MTSDTRKVVLDELAGAVTSLWLAHPTRVAIDGRSAAGKTTLGNELAEELQARGREVIRASIDDFHRPGHKYRSQRGGWTPRSYYDEGYDYKAFHDVLLEPLGPGGNRRCRTGMLDAFNDVWLPVEWHEVGSGTIAVIDGVFLLRPELAEHWDYIVWLDIDMETMVERACLRDVAWVGSVHVVEERYRRHWIETHELYERLTDASSLAHALIDNRDPEEPKFLRPLA